MEETRKHAISSKFDVGFQAGWRKVALSEMRAQSRRSPKLGIDFVARLRIRGLMQRDQEHPPEDMIAKLMLATGLLVEEVSPELATPILPSCDALEARIAVVERVTEDLGAIATSARAILRLVRP